MFVVCHATYVCRKEGEERLVIIWRKHIHCLPFRKFSDSCSQFRLTDWMELPAVSGVSTSGILITMGLARGSGMIIMLSKLVMETYF